MDSPPKIYDYFTLVYAPDNLRAFENGYVPEHILVVEEALGRALTNDEDVRHLNGNTQDNDIENLEVTSFHASYRTISFGDENQGKVHKASSQTFIPCKFQKPCWKEIRAPLARKNKQYLPYICSYQSEGDIYACGRFWTYLEKGSSEIIDIQANGPIGDNL